MNLAGHIVVEDFAVLGGLTAVHQFVKISALMPPWSEADPGSEGRPSPCQAAREPLSFAGVNSIGLRRRGFTNEQVHAIQENLQILFVRGYNTSQALTLIESTIPASIERDNILQFIQNADRDHERLSSDQRVKAHGDIMIESANGIGEWVFRGRSLHSSGGTSGCAGAKWVRKSTLLQIMAVVTPFRR